MFVKVRNDKALWQVFIYLVTVIIFFVEKTFNLGGYNIYSKIDNLIPFVPIFVIPYFSWFLFIIGTGLIFLIKSKQDLRKTFLSVNLCMVIALLVYLIFPNYQSLRPETYASDIFSQWVKLLQIKDSSSEVCPSLHVAVCISLYTGITHSICFRDRSIMKFLALILTILIILSTVFIKQHSIVDVAFGLLLGVVVHLFVYKIYFNPTLFPNRVENWEISDNRSCPKVS